MQGDSFSFLILILPVYLIVRLGFDAKIFDGIPKILFNFCLPALILISFTDFDSGVLYQDALFVAVFIAIITPLCYLLAQLALRRYQNGARKEILIFNMMVGNVTFVGLPFIAYFFGTWGVRLAILSSIVQDFFIWSLCYWMFAPKGGLKQTFKVVLNPCFISVVVGLILLSLQISLPDLMEMPLHMLADMTVPLALLFIGSLLARNTGVLKRIDRDALVSVAIKTFLLPAITFGILTLLGVDPRFILFCTFMVALPVPLLAVLFSKEFDKDVAFTNVVFILSTVTFILCCIVLFFVLG